ncbi:MAG: 3-isopropylmalate dehydratase small subunit [Thiothrix nivea]|nr:MAG: 3-isopropylmalate dehydratase small subunit [Thiothrix nivea]
MEPYQKHTSVVVLMNRNNVDTDQIIPKQFLKKVERTGFGQHLFHDWRFNADGSENPEFELNRPEVQGAKILLAGDNFGCGSSREHAPWAIEDYGFNTIISTSYADIFYNNCFKNGILPVVVDEATWNELRREVEAAPGLSFAVDLEAQTVTTPTGRVVGFDLDPVRKNNLLKGLDDIAVSLQHEARISAFEARQKEALPWLWRNAS